ncbi:hypothetical protein EVAR_53882_1 [Eumeta japonica]|uniref:Uncharacterized protein n=1 Tax=Eumeta variegata TaxID=151549 RepID=A0A4C1XHY8_EUMVA|nr:hypothetical protein EVAR_53882_1 [Eumeta japonica]
MNKPAPTCTDYATSHLASNNPVTWVPEPLLDLQHTQAVSDPQANVASDQNGILLFYRQGYRTNFVPTGASSA